MASKLKQMADDKAAAASGLFDNALAGQVKDSAQQIWLAGLGAFSRAQAEGTKVFEALVKEGAGLQKKTQSAAEDKISEVTNRVSSMAGDVQARAGLHWDRLEGIFEDRTARAMKKLGVPSAKDVDDLLARLDALEAKVDKLSRSAAGRRSTGQAAARGSADRKPAAKKRAAPRKAAAA